MLLHQEDKSPAKTKEIREIYKVVCKRHGVNPISTRSVREYLAELSQIILIARLRASGV
jgi:Cdc6-like AAA superfamily ATPase